MKLLLSFLLALPLTTLAQKPPADIRTAAAVLTITCEASKYEERKVAVLSGLENQGLSVKNTFHLHENPTLRAKEGEATKKLILNENPKYIYLVQVLIVGSDYNYVLLIAEPKILTRLKLKYITKHSETRSRNFLRTFLRI